MSLTNSADCKLGPAVRLDDIRAEVIRQASAGGKIYSKFHE